VWRDRALSRILSRLACRGIMRPNKTARSFWPGVQARPRFSPPLPLVQDRVVSDTEFAGGLRAAKGRLQIRPVARLEARRRRPPTSESNENSLTTGHQAL